LFLIQLGWILTGDRTTR